MSALASRPWVLAPCALLSGRVPLEGHPPAPQTGRLPALEGFFTLRVGWSPAPHTVALHLLPRAGLLLCGLWLQAGPLPEGRAPSSEICCGHIVRLFSQTASMSYVCLCCNFYVNKTLFAPSLLSALPPHAQLLTLPPF